MELDVWIIHVIYLVVFLVSGMQLRGSTIFRCL